MSNNHQLQKNNPRLEEDLALKFLDVQKQELDIRAKDFEIRKASEEHQFEYATSALKAIGRNRAANKSNA